MILFFLGYCTFFTSLLLDAAGSSISLGFVEHRAQTWWSCEMEEAVGYAGILIRLAGVMGNADLRPGL